MEKSKWRVVVKELLEAVAPVIARILVALLAAKEVGDAVVAPAAAQVFASLT